MTLFDFLIMVYHGIMCIMVQNNSGVVRAGNYISGVYYAMIKIA